MEGFQILEIYSAASPQISSSFSIHRLKINIECRKEERKTVYQLNNNRSKFIWIVLKRKFSFSHFTNKFRRVPFCEKKKKFQWENKTKRHKFVRQFIISKCESTFFLFGLLFFVAQWMNENCFYWKFIEQKFRFTLFTIAIKNKENSLPLRPQGRRD